jgi:hypothetical protein
MSSGQKAVSEAEDDWYDLKKRAGISVSYGVFSSEAGFVKDGFGLGYTGKLLEAYVGHRQQLLELDRKKRDLTEKWNKFVQAYNEFIK